MPFAVFQPVEEAVLCEFDVNRLLFDVFGMIMLFFVRFGHNQLLKDIWRQSPLQFVLSGSKPFFFCS